MGQALQEAMLAEVQRRLDRFQVRPAVWLSGCLAVCLAGLLAPARATHLPRPWRRRRR